jgi:L-threonylcarbamoyladenylate synthase
MQKISNSTDDKIKRAAYALSQGHLVAFPTETVYGLGADACNEKAVSRVYSVKGRPLDHPLIVHISSIEQMDKWAIDIPKYAINFARQFWPGAMTLILKRSSVAKDYVTGSQKFVGLRIPSHPVALSLLSEFEKLGGLGVAAPSANRFGALSPTTSTAVAEELEQYLLSSDLILNGGQSSLGIESTIIDCTQKVPTILRPGSITSEMLGILGNSSESNHLQENIIKVSGALEFHYAPKATVTVGELAKPGEGFIALSDIPTPIGAHRLASPKDIKEFAYELYEALRDGDRQQLREIKVIIPSGQGLAESIRDRVVKAAKRPVGT